MRISREIGIIAVAAVLTLLTRALPFLLFGRKAQPPQIVRFLGNALPPSVMAVLVIYCLRNVSFAEPGGFLPEILASAAVALLHIWKKSIFISIGLGTALYMLLVQFVFV